MEVTEQPSVGACFHARQVPSVKTDGQWHEPSRPAKLPTSAHALSKVIDAPSKKVHQGGRFAPLADLDYEDGKYGCVLLQ